MTEAKNTWTTRTAKRILLKTFEKFKEGYLEVICPDETYTFGVPDAELRGTLKIHDERMFKRVLLGGDIGFGEAYMDGDWSSPDIVEVFRMMIKNIALVEEENRLMSFIKGKFDWLLHKLRSNTLTGSRKNIRHHYDLSNDFYKLFLDSTMAYSCGVYEKPDDSLHLSQLQKFDLICRKLQLSPQDHLLEIGTGWGGFAIYAATQYGCKITTTTISQEQYKLAAERFARFGYGKDRIELLCEDYRNLQGQYDKIVSIEMFEAVGYDYYDEYFAACDRLLAPDGAMLLQTISIPDQRFDQYRKRADWIQKYIFPGGELASVGGILRSLARATKMSLHHAENIGTHYARTLSAWREKFHKSVERVRALGFDERFIRMWDYYLASCEAAFLERDIGDYQLLLAKNSTSEALFGEPWKDADNYPSPRKELAVDLDW
jgi:cyclopropane-fatty-acyl-phospholipid synthase